MQPSGFIFTGLLGASTVLSFEWAIPSSLEHGVYGIYFDKHDEFMTRPKFERIEGSEAIGGNKSPTLLSQKRSFQDIEPLVYDHHSTPPIEIPVSSQGCTESRAPLDPDEHWQAKQLMYWECDRGRRVHRYFGQWATNGTVAVWVCSCKWFGFMNPCPLEELYAAETIFNHTCGDDKGAWVHMKEWRKSYGRGTKGDKIHCPCW
ncbi:hypothetical protein BGZ63DRAFT_420123 [Mariannaea sp. PMI_226]|nr:hypothetical protein BGZ63DRAFT_420123 [Mariannaea sp. PMI_226]